MVSKHRISLSRFVLFIVVVYKISFVNCLNNKSNQIPQHKECRPTQQITAKQRWWVDDEESNQTPAEKITSIYIQILEQKAIRLDEGKNELELHLKGQLLWEDERIHTNFSAYDLKNGWLMVSWEKMKAITQRGEMIWMPTFFVRDLAKVTSPYGDNSFNVFTKLEFLTHNPFHENITLVRLSFTVKITLLCDFQYDNYPMDTQLCPLRFFTETSQNLELHLYDPEIKNHRSETNLDRLGFDITTNFIEISSSENSGVFEVGFDMILKRIYRPFIYQYYIPSFTIVCVSTFSFVVPLTAIPGRISLAVTNLLCLVTMYINQMVNFFI